MPLAIIFRAVGAVAAKPKFVAPSAQDIRERQRRENIIARGKREARRPWIKFPNNKARPERPK